MPVSTTPRHDLRSRPFLSHKDHGYFLTARRKLRAWMVLASGVEPGRHRAEPDFWRLGMHDE